MVITTQNERGERPFFLLLVLLLILQRDGVSLLFRLGFLGGSARGRSMVRGEVQDALLCLVVGKVVFRRYVFHYIIVRFSKPRQLKIPFGLLTSK
jgi:hypothetical protein